MKSFDLCTIVLGLTVSASVLGCAAETEEPETDEPNVVLPWVPVVTPTPEEKPAQQAQDNAANGSGVRPLAAGKPPKDDDGGCPVWGCGSNHNRRLVRI